MPILSSLYFLIGFNDRYAPAIVPKPDISENPFALGPHLFSSSRTWQKMGAFGGTGSSQMLPTLISPKGDQSTTPTLADVKFPFNAYFKLLISLIGFNDPMHRPLLLNPTSAKILLP